MLYAYERNSTVAPHTCTVPQLIALFSVLEIHTYCKLMFQLFISVTVGGITANRAADNVFTRRDLLCDFDLLIGKTTINHSHSIIIQ